MTENRCSGGRYTVIFTKSGSPERGRCLLFWGEGQWPSIRKPGGEQKVGRLRTEGKALTERTRRKPAWGAQRGRTGTHGYKTGPFKDSG